MALHRKSTLIVVFFLCLALLSCKHDKTAKSGETAQVPPSLLGVPRPPAIVGCYQLAAQSAAGQTRQWSGVPCIPAEKMSHIPHLNVGGGAPAPGVQSSFQIIPKQGKFVAAGTAGLVGSWVAVSPIGNWSETDTINHHTSFSVQDNTNYFVATCHSQNEPLPYFESSYYQNKCTNGDTAWVQFTYQASNWAIDDDTLCVWNVDVSKQWYYIPQTWTICEKIRKAGFWPSGESIVIEGSIDPTSHTIALTASLPWSGWFSVVAPDWFGLCWDQLNGPCPWVEVTGSMFGDGNGSVAVFAPGNSLQTTVGATPCEFSVWGNQPICPSMSIPYNPYVGIPTSAAVTGESNNLNYYYFGGPSVACSSDICSLSYTATASPPPP